MIVLFLTMSAIQSLLGSSSVTVFMAFRVLTDCSYINIFVFVFVTMSVRSLRSTRLSSNSGNGSNSRLKGQRVVSLSSSDSNRNNNGSRIPLKSVSESLELGLNTAHLHEAPDELAPQTLPPRMRDILPRIDAGQPEL